MRCFAIFAVLVAVSTASAQSPAPNLEAKDASGWTALMSAAEMGKVDEIKALLAKGANLEASDPKVYDGATPLVLALHFDQHDAAMLLLDRHASTAGKLGTDAMVLAARSGFDDIIDRLLASKISPKDTLALELAAKYGHVSTIKKLVKAGAVVRWVDKADHDFTPFIVACQERQVDAARALLELGANVNDVDGDGTPALHWAVFAERPEEMHIYPEGGGPHDTEWIPHHDAPLVALLIANKVKLDVVDRDKNTALHQAAMMDSAAAAELLIAAKVSQKAKNKEGRTAYELARERNNSVEPLLRPAGAKTPVGPRQHAPDRPSKSH
jgi:ankyrin repeat protein